MNYLSVCSGIEAATVAWHPLGWNPVAYSEIEPFPCALLAHHYPNTPNLGDMTKYHEWPELAVDLVCGGTPCQSFSVAGLRKGMDDPRGNLALTFLGIVDRYRPRWVVWENVPGILSDKTGALAQLLDGLEELGYIIDLDVLDAQYFGVPQRRRRLFICGQHRDDLLSKKTISSALTVAQCLQETLQLTLAVLSDPSKAELGNCAFDATKPRHSLQKRIRLFGMDLEGAAARLAASLAVMQQWSGRAQSDSGLESGSGNQGSSVDTRSQRSNQQTDVAGECQNIEKSWLSTLDVPLRTMNECIISTAISEITESKIYSCAQLALNIAGHITQSMDSSPNFWSAASSSLTTVRGFINYARQASSNIFTGAEWIRAWGNFLGEAEYTELTLRNLRIGNFGEVLPIAHSLCGHTPPRREAGKSVAALTANGVGTCGADDNQGQAGHEGKFSLRAHPEGIDENLIAHTLRGDGFDASEDGTGRGTPLVPVAFALRGREGGAMPEVNGDGSQVGSLRAASGGSSRDYIAFDTTQITSAANYSNPKPGDPCHPLAAGAHAPAVAYAIQERAVSENISLEARHKTQYVSAPGARRLTPRECERLQGFPDDYTLVPFGRPSKAKLDADFLKYQLRGNPKHLSRADIDRLAADGPRYRALGNSWAVPCARWIGERIADVERFQSIKN